MRAPWRRIIPYLLAVLLLLNLVEAITGGGRENWITVAIIALLLAFTLWRQRHPES